MRTLLTLSLLGTLTFAQETVRPRHNASYVPDDNETIRSMVADAIDKAEAGNADGTADALQALLLNQEAGLVAVRGRELFTSPSRWAAIQLLSERAPFGADVLEAWRAAHGNRANAAISAAIESGDRLAVTRLVRRYPAATLAPGALLALCDRALQRGDRDLAWAGLMRAREHVARTAKAAWLASPAYVTRRRHLESIEPRRPAHWSTLGGDASRARNGDAIPDAANLTKRWDAPLLDKALTNFEVQTQTSSREHSPILPFYPVFDGDHMYVHLGPKVAMVSRRSGRRLYYAPDGKYPVPSEIDSLIAKSPGVRAATVIDGILYFHQMRFRRMFGKIEPLRHNTLVAFDVKKRTVLWQIPRRAGRRPTALRKKLFFRGAPAVSRGRLYAYAAVREESEGRPSRKEEAYLYCFDARTGALQWHRFLGYGDTEAAPDMPPQSGLAPAVAYGVVVVVTGLGVAVAVDADTGEVLWLLRYDRKPVRERDRLTERTEKQVHLGSGWFREAPRIVGDMVFFAPIDSDQRYGCWLRGDQTEQDGGFYLQQWAVARNANPGRNSLLEQIAGIGRDRIFFVGRRDERAGVVETYQTLVSNPLRRGDDSFAYGRIPAVERDEGTGLRVPPEVFGRCTIAGSVLLIPTRRALYRFDIGQAPREKMRAHERFQEIPPLTPFTPPPGKTVAGKTAPPQFGTLVATGGMLYAVTTQRVICYGPAK